MTDGLQTIEPDCGQINMMDDHDIIADDVDQLIRLLLSSIYTHEKNKQKKNRME